MYLSKSLLLSQHKHKYFWLPLVLAQDAFTAKGNTFLSFFRREKGLVWQNRWEQTRPAVGPALPPAPYPVGIYHSNITGVRWFKNCLNAQNCDVRFSYSFAAYLKFNFDGVPSTKSFFWRDEKERDEKKQDLERLKYWNREQSLLFLPLPNSQM